MVVALISIAFSGGTLIGDTRARVESLEAWRKDIALLADSRDLRLRALEADSRALDEHLEAIERALQRIERQLDGNPHVK